MAATDAYVMRIRGEDMARLGRILSSAKRAGSMGVIGPALVAGALHVENEAKRLVRKKSGSLARSLHTSAPRISMRGVAVSVGTDLKYAPAIEYGAGPHVIRPRNAGMLRFVVGGRVVYARRVNHPGNRPYPYLRPAAANQRSKVYAEVINAVVEIVSKAA